MNKKTLLSFLLLISLSVLLPAGGVMDFFAEEEPEEPTVQDVYGDMGEDIPVIGFFYPQYGSGVNPEEGERLLRDLTEAFVWRGKLKPGYLEEWMDQEYADDAPRGIIDINDRIVREKIPLDYTASLNIKRYRDRFFVRLAVYTPGKNGRTIYIYRFLKDLEQDWIRQLSGMLDELDYRLAGKEHNYLSDMIYIEPFTVQYFEYYELQSGEFTFSELPFLTVEGLDYNTGDDLFSEWLGLRLHLSGYFPVVIHDLKDRVDAVPENPGKRKGCAWGILGEVRISPVMSVLRLHVYSYPRQETVASYDFLFNGLDTVSVGDVLDTALPYLIERVVSNEVKKSLTVITPEFSGAGSQIYTAEGYQGPRELVKSFPARLGLNRFLIESDDFAPSDLSGFNAAVLVGPDGRIDGEFSEKEIRYAEKLFE